jgi:hypothetical protein
VNRLLRIILASVGLCLTAGYWLATSLYLFGSVAGENFVPESAFEIRLRIAVIIASAMVIYAIGVHVWRRLDDSLRHRQGSN